MESAVDDGAVSCEVNGSWLSSADEPPNEWTLFVRLADGPAEARLALLDIFSVRCPTHAAQKERAALIFVDANQAQIRLHKAVHRNLKFD